MEAAPNRWIDAGPMGQETKYVSTYFAALLRIIPAAIHPLDTVRGTRNLGNALAGAILSALRLSRLRRKNELEANRHPQPFFFTASASA